MPNLKLKSAEGDITEISIDGAWQIDVFRDMLVVCAIPDKEEDWPIISLPHISTETLLALVEWAELQKLNSVTESTIWQKGFLLRYESIWIKLIKSADYLHLESLLEVLSKEVADIISQKTFAELRSFLEQDVADETQLRLKEGVCNPWLTPLMGDAPNREYIAIIRMALRIAKEKKEASDAEARSQIEEEDVSENASDDFSDLQP